MEALSFKLEIFEGPLDLLLSLIAKNKYDIFDIPISEILDQYLSYLEEMRKMDMDIAGDFIAMASTLMLIKSRMMLPKPKEEDEEDPRLELAQALVEYQRAKEAAELLAGNYDIYSGRVTKETDEAPFESIPELKDQDPGLLAEAFALVKKRYEEMRSEESSERSIERLFRRKPTPIPQRIKGIIKFLSERKKTTFDDVIMTSKTRSDIVASFIAILELLKSERIRLSKKNDTIYIEQIEGAERYDGQVTAESYD